MVGKTAGLRAERSGVLIWVGTRGFCLFQNVLPALRTTEPPVQWVPGFFPRGMAAVRDVDPPSCAEVTKEWSCTSTVPLWCEQEKLLITFFERYFI